MKPTMNQNTFEASDLVTLTGDLVAAFRDFSSEASRTAEEGSCLTLR